MAIEFSSVSSVQIALTGRQALRFIGVQRATSTGVVEGDPALPGGIKAGRFNLEPVVLNVNDAGTALAKAVVAAFGILGALQAIENTLGIATQSSLVNPSAGILADGTRVSRLNIHSEVRRVIKGIDTLVERSAFKNANLISSVARDIRIQTTGFGGRLTVVPQPLDSTSLGIAGLNALTDEEAELAVRLVVKAITLARTRVGNLESLQVAVGAAAAAAQSFTRAFGADISDILQRGSFVNLTA